MKTYLKYIKESNDTENKKKLFSYLDKIIIKFDLILNNDQFFYFDNRKLICGIAIVKQDTTFNYSSACYFNKNFLSSINKDYIPFDRNLFIVNILEDFVEKLSNRNLLLDTYSTNYSNYLELIFNN